MPHSIAAFRARLAPFWRGSAPLTVVACLMLPVLAVLAVGLWVDTRTILGVPVWLKPAKFAASIAVYAATLAWVLGHLPPASRLARNVGWLSALVLVLEQGIISVQAGRGTTSHFNVGTPLDAVLFGVMGAAIVTQTLASAVVAVALWRSRLPDRALGWALRLGLSITIVGASFGGIMSRPSDDQLQALEAGRPSPAGAHTVGGADGGPGLVGTGWSREHGDVRVPHFFGLHALQVLPLVAFGLRRTRLSEARRARLVMAAGASYAGLVALLLWQALRGQALLAPDGVTALAALAWLVASLGLAWRALGRRGVAPAPIAFFTREENPR
jgi:hypothetical protein